MCMRNILSSVFHFLKKETVLSVASVLAVISAFMIHPDKEYLSYIDVRVLAVLFCLMIVMQCYQEAGVFSWLAEKLLARCHTSRQLEAVLVFLCFFSSMLISNDVALITFVPFAILTLSMSSLRNRIIPVVVLQTVAANLGSMLTPIGNPQNLYLFSLSGMNIGAFTIILLPWTILAFILLSCWLCLSRSMPVVLPATSCHQGFQRNMTVVCSVLFAISVLSVFRILHYGIAFVVVFISILLYARRLLRQVNYALLCTFVAFFVFIGNMGRIPQIRSFLESVISGHEFVVSVIASQVVSNVPAALLLSGFTDKYIPILLGVNIGGLGTLIASLASLISYQYAAKALPEKKGSYLVYFTAVNMVFLVLLVCGVLVLNMFVTIV